MDLQRREIALCCVSRLDGAERDRLSGANRRGGRKKMNAHNKVFLKGNTQQNMLIANP